MKRIPCLAGLFFQFCMYFSNLISPNWDVFQVYSFYGKGLCKTLKYSREKLSSSSVLSQYCYIPNTVFFFFLNCKPIPVFSKPV